MENQYQKYRFSAISIKKEVADRFRKFSRELSLSNTDTMEAMLNFFSYNNLLPSDDLGIKSDTTRKRINALIAIVRNIEKQQTLPTKAMLDALFQEITQVQHDEEEEDFFEGFNDGGSEKDGEKEIFNPDTGNNKELTRDEQLLYYQNRYTEMQQELSHYKNLLLQLSGQLRYTKNTFGKDFYKLEISPEEFEKLRNNF
tara:strand:+ start:1171 stop:1767 length:597 start_codon:yes stop_codon:yes gene_type:complete